MDEQDSGLVGQVQTTPEVQTVPPPATTMPDRSRQIADQLAILHKSISRGAGWFYWVAGLSIANTIVALFHGSWLYPFGLVATRLARGFTYDDGTDVVAIVLPIKLLIAGVYVLFGYCANRRMRWAFYVGTVFYALDGLLLLLAHQWLCVAVHAWVLFGIIRGIKADFAARQLTGLHADTRKERLAVKEQDSGVVKQGQAPDDLQVASPLGVSTSDREAYNSNELAMLHRSIARGANWCFWVGGLSIGNTVIALFNGGSYLFGLGITQIGDAAIREFGMKAAMICVPITLLFAAIYVLLGYYANRRRRWAFYAAMVLYSLDGLILFFLDSDWLGMAFHVLIVFAISRGLKADSLGRQLERQPA